MKYYYLGKIVNTHGIKGEIRILSDFDKKEMVFQSEFPIYIGKEKNRQVIQTYRHHKNFEMVSLKGYTNINEVLSFVGQSVYVRKEDLSLQESDYLLEELIGCEIIENQEMIGKIIDIVYNKANILLKATNQKKIFYIPKNEAYIIKVDIKKQKVYTKDAQGLIL